MILIILDFFSKFIVAILTLFVATIFFILFFLIFIAVCHLINDISKNHMDYIKTGSWYLVNYGMWGVSKTIIFGNQIYAKLAPIFQQYFHADKNDPGDIDDDTIEIFLVEFIWKNTRILNMEFRILRTNKDATPSIILFSVKKVNVMDCIIHIHEKEMIAEMVGALDMLHALFVPPEFDFYLISRIHRGKCTTKIQRTEPTCILTYFSPHVPTTAIPLRIDLKFHDDADPVEIFFHQKDNAWNFLLIDNVFDQVFLTFLINQYMPVKMDDDDDITYFLTIIDDVVNIHRFTEKDQFTIVAPCSTNDTSMFLKLETTI